MCPGFVATLHGGLVGGGSEVFGRARPPVTLSAQYAPSPKSTVRKASVADAFRTLDVLGGAYWTETAPSAVRRGRPPPHPAAVDVGRGHRTRHTEQRARGRRPRRRVVHLRPDRPHRARGLRLR